MTDQEKKDVEHAIDGKFSGELSELETVLANLALAKEAATNHGRFKRIDIAMDKIRMKINRLKS